MTRAALLLAALTLVAACATTTRPVYVKAGVSEADRKKDNAECLKVAVSANLDTRTFGAYSFDREQYDTCMRGRGYTAQATR